MNFQELKNKMKRYLYLLLLPFLASCNFNKPEIKDVLSNYLKYDKTYDENTFEVKKIDALKDRKDDFVLGADISLFEAIVESGANYYNSKGYKQSICKILKDSGINTVRVRLFNDYNSPVGNPIGKQDLKRVISMLEEIKKSDLTVILDFHYSDTWADPENQGAPYAWRNYSYSQVVEELYEYTKTTLEEIKNNKLNIDYVQVGNEIDNGLIFPYGKIDWDNREPSYDKVVEILSSGSKAVREVFPDAKVIIHTANGLYRWTYEEQWGNVSLEFYEALEKRHLDYDIIGASFYTFVNDTPISYISDIIDNYQKTVKKPVMMMETSYAYTYEWNEYTNNIFYKDKELKDYPVSYQGQTNLICDLIEEVASAKDNKGIGVCYWGGEFIPNTDKDMKTTWANQALFTYEGVATPTLSLFNKI